MRFERLDLNLLATLDALLEDHSVTVAARRLHLSQPAISGGLNRLRDYFGDDLLVQVGRQMILTPKAEELRAPVREALMLIRTKITTPATFDPGTAKRQFTIVASDFAYNVLLVDALAEAAAIAPDIAFDVVDTGQRGLEMLWRGEADLIISISSFLADEHPKLPLFGDEHAIIAWRDGRYGRGLTKEDFFAAQHAVVMFGHERVAAFSESFFEKQGIQRKIQLRVPNFAALSAAIPGTDRIATVYRRHAELFARSLPISVHAPPIPMPNVVEEVQWHSLRGSDPGLQWLIGLLRAHGSRLDAGLPRR